MKFENWIDLIYYDESSYEKNFKETKCTAANEPAYRNKLYPEAPSEGSCYDAPTPSAAHEKFPQESSDDEAPQTSAWHGGSFGKGFGPWRLLDRPRMNCPQNTFLNQHRLHHNQQQGVDLKIPRESPSCQNSRTWVFFILSLLLLTLALGRQFFSIL